MTPVRYLRIRDAELSVRVANLLCKSLGEHATMGDVFEQPDLHLLNSGIGRKGLKEVREMIELARVNGDFEPRPPTSGSSIVPPDTRGAKTLRDEFAMAALTGLVSIPQRVLRSILQEGETISVTAYRIADAMMEARGR